MVCTIKDLFLAKSSCLKAKRAAAVVLFAIVVFIAAYSFVKSYKSARAQERLTAILSVVVAMYESPDHAMVLVDSEHRICFWPKGAEVLFGWKESEIMGKDLDAIMPDGKREMHHTKFNAAVAEPDTSKTTVIKCVAKRKDGTPVEIRVTVRMYTVLDYVFASAQIDPQDSVQYLDARPPEFKAKN